MYDVKPEIFALLSTIPGVARVSDEFPSADAAMPVITFFEVADSDPLTIANGPLSDVTIQIDVWHNRSTGVLAAQVDEKMNSIGFRRVTKGDLADPSGLKRKTMRYRGVIDSRSGRVSQ